MRYGTNSRWGPVCRQLARQTQFHLRNTGVHLLPPLQGPADDTAAWKSLFSPGRYSPALVSSCQSKVHAVIVNSPGPHLCSQVSCCEAARCGMGVSSAPIPLRSRGERQNAEGARVHKEMMSNLFPRACCLGEMPCALKLLAQHHPCCLDLWVVYSVTSLPPPIPFLKKWNSWATVGAFLKSWLSYEVGMQVWPASSTDFSCQSTAELKPSFFICNCRKQGT